MSDVPSRQFTALDLELLREDTVDGYDDAAASTENEREFSSLELELLEEDTGYGYDDATASTENKREFTAQELELPGEDTGNGSDNATTSVQGTREFTELELELLGEDTGNGSHNAITSQNNLPAAAPSQRKPNVKPHPFDKTWSAKQHPQNWTDEEREERFLIEGRRAAMSASQFWLSPHLKDPKHSAYEKIRYQFQVLSRYGVDIKPQSEEYRRRCQQMNTPMRKEAAQIILACQSGMTPNEIQESGLVRYGKNGLDDLKERIYKMKQRGVDVAPRPAGQVPRPI